MQCCLKIHISSTFNCGVIGCTENSLLRSETLFWTDRQFFQEFWYHHELSLLANTFLPNNDTFTCYQLLSSFAWLLQVFRYLWFKILDSIGIYWKCVLHKSPDWKLSLGMLFHSHINTLTFDSRICPLCQWIIQCFSRPSCITQFVSYVCDGWCAPSYKCTTVLFDLFVQMVNPSCISRLIF